MDEAGWREVNKTYFLQERNVFFYFCQKKPYLYRSGTNINSPFRDAKDLGKDFNNMMYRIGGWIDREHGDLQVYYAKGMIGRFLWRLKIHNNPSYARGALPAGRSFL